MLRQFLKLFASPAQLPDDHIETTSPEGPAADAAGFVPMTREMIEATFGITAGPEYARYRSWQSRPFEGRKKEWLVPVDQLPSEAPEESPIEGTWASMPDIGTAVGRRYIDCYYPVGMILNWPKRKAPAGTRIKTQYYVPVGGLARLEAFFLEREPAQAEPDKPIEPVANSAKPSDQMTLSLPETATDEALFDNAVAMMAAGYQKVAQSYELINRIPKSKRYDFELRVKEEARNLNRRQRYAIERRMRDQAEKVAN